MTMHISKEQAREFAAACYDQIIKEIREIQTPKEEITNDEQENNTAKD